MRCNGEQDKWVGVQSGTNFEEQKRKVEKQLAKAQSVMYLLTQVRRNRLLDHTGADNEEVNKRNGTLKCSSTTQVPQFNL